MRLIPRSKPRSIFVSLGAFTLVLLFVLPTTVRASMRLLDEGLRAPALTAFFQDGGEGASSQVAGIGAENEPGKLPAPSQVAISMRAISASNRCVLRRPRLCLLRIRRWTA
jgi:hypothetical protein